MFANVNILTDEECLKLQKNIKKLGWNKNYEICVGKKHRFPNEYPTFIRSKKDLTELEKGKKAKTSK